MQRGSVKGNEDVHKETGVQKALRVCIRQRGGANEEVKKAVAECKRQ